MPAFPEKESSLLAKLKKYKANQAGSQQLDEESEASGATGSGGATKSTPAAKMKSTDGASSVANGDAVNNLSGKSSPVPEPVSV